MPATAESKFTLFGLGGEKSTTSCSCKWADALSRVNLGWGRWILHLLLSPALQSGLGYLKPSQCKPVSHWHKKGGERGSHFECPSCQPLQQKSYSQVLWVVSPLPPSTTCRPCSSSTAVGGDRPVVCCELPCGPGELAPVFQEGNSPGALFQFQRRLDCLGVSQLVCCLISSRFYLLKFLRHFQWALSYSVSYSLGSYS